MLDKQLVNELFQLWKDLGEAGEVHISRGFSDKLQILENRVNKYNSLHSVSEPFTNKQSHKVRRLLKEFYLWMQENDYEHTIPKRVESKAEQFLQEKNVR